MVIDNCEHVIEAAGALVEGLTSASETVVVIATSREPLGVDGEAVVRLAPLALPGPLATPSEITTCASVALFVDRARLALATFEPDGVLDEIAQICRRVDGLPLAIELAAARVGVLSTGDIAVGLDRRFQLLAGGARTAVARHRSMRACIDWSIQLLGDDERTVLDRLSVFPSSWTLASARGSSPTAALDADAVEDSVLALVHRSLVVTSGGTPSRYRLPDRSATMRPRSCSVPAGARRSWRGCSTTSVVAVQRPATSWRAGTSTSWSASSPPTTTSWWRSSTTPLPRATTWCGSCIPRSPSIGPRPGGSRRRSGGTPMCERRPPPSPAIAARAQWAAAYTSVYGGRFDVGVERATAALSSARAAGDDSSIARALEVLGLNSFFSDTVATEEHLRAAFDLAERAGDVWCAVDTAQCLGYMLIGVGRLSEAELWLRRGAGTSNPMLAAWDAAGNALVTMLRGGTDGVDADLARAAELAGAPATRTSPAACWRGAPSGPLGTALPMSGWSQCCPRSTAAPAPAPGRPCRSWRRRPSSCSARPATWEAADAIWGAYAPAAHRRDADGAAPAGVRRGGERRRPRAVRGGRDADRARPVHGRLPGPPARGRRGRHLARRGRPRRG